MYFQSMTMTCVIGLYKSCNNVSCLLQYHNQNQVLSMYNTQSCVLKVSVTVTENIHFRKEGSNSDLEINTEPVQTSRNISFILR
jgi:hypothetical protein